MTRLPIKLTLTEEKKLAIHLATREKSVIFSMKKKTQQNSIRKKTR